MENKKIQTMFEAGVILGDVLQEVVNYIKPGITELEIDKYAEKLIRQKGGEPGFKKVPGYKHTICVSTNNVVVHGIPKKRILKTGDIIGIDCGVFLNGYHTDMAETVIVGKTEDKKVLKFLEIGKKSMFNAILKAKAGNRVGDISKAMQETVEGGGYSIVRSLVGHGVGKELHEDPEIPGYLDKKIEKTPILKEGMTIAIEVIYNFGKKDVEYDGSDDWTIVTKDNSLAGLFERTVLVTKEGPKLITRFKDDPVQ